MADRIGKQFGNYRLVQLLGHGGFAEVYLGEHIHLGTQAAVKILSTHLAAKEIEQFREEARLIAHFEHPHIIRVFDFGLEGTTPFFVMSYAPGGTLGQKHPKRACLPLALVVSYCNQIASALEYAHCNKRIHRDIKPENMLVGPNGDILLSDFGIAVVSQSSRYQGKQEVGGTVAYMAPEQLNGKAVVASDQYALGIVLYEWLSGDVPFTGSFTEICSQHFFTTPASLCKKLPSLSARVEEVIFRALAKDPNQRYPNMDAFAAAFEHAVQDDQSTFIKENTMATLLNESRILTVKREVPRESRILTVKREVPKEEKDAPSASFVQPNKKENTPLLVIPPSPQQTNNKRYLAMIAALICIILVMGTGGWYLFTTQKASRTGTPATNAPSAGGTSRQQSPAGTTIVSGPSTPTPVTKNISENIQFSCASMEYPSIATCNNVGFVVQLNNIKIDPSYGPQGQMTFYFTLTNKGTQPLQITAGGGYPGVSIYLEDPEAKSTQADGGTFLDTNSIGVGTFLPVTAIIPLTPQNGVTYLLHMTLISFGNSDYGGNAITYGTIPLQFSL